MRKKRIGIYGGSFNPPHRGHILAAQQAVDLLELDRLLLVPAAVPPHKQIPVGTPAPETRLKLLQLSAAEIPCAQVCDLELQRGGTSYTADTIEQLSRIYADDTLILLMGTDMFLSFHQWYHPERICRHSAIAVMIRDGEVSQDILDEQKKRIESTFNGKVRFVHNEFIPISSTDIRRMLIFRCAQDYLLPDVYEEILCSGTYCTGVSYDRLPMEQLEAVVAQLLKANRVRHVLGCRDTAVELAIRYGADPVDAARAGILHDITKALRGQEQIHACRCYGIPLDVFALANPKTLHAKTGSYVARMIFKENPAVCSAIEWHTTGRAGMNTLEKILYIADYMEPSRDFPGVEELRELTRQSLDLAVLRGLEMTADMLRQQHKPIASESLEAAAWLREQM